MFIDRYPDNESFFNATQHYYSLLRSGFVRNPHGVRSICKEWNISTSNGVFSKANMLEIKKATPILGTIMGLGRLYSIWSTKDHTTSKIQLLLHTLTGVVETAGLGIILLIAKIMRLAIKTLCEKVNLYSFCNRYQNLETSSTSSEDSTFSTDQEERNIRHTPLTRERINHTITTATELVSDLTTINEENRNIVGNVTQLLNTLETSLQNQENEILDLSASDSEEVSEITIV
ncbi:hypothetical protein [Chlamydia crocodili]